MERFAEDLAEWMAARDHSVTVLTHTPGAVGGDRHRNYRVARRVRPTVTASILGNADVVHVNGLSLKGIAAASMARHRPVVTHQSYPSICPVAVAWSERGNCDVAPQTSSRCSVCPKQGLAGRARVGLHRAGAAAAAVNVCVSRYLAAETNLPRSVTVYNPVSRRAFDSELNSGEQNELVVFAGRLVTEKGVDVLLRAMAILPNVQLRIAGEGPMKLTWERLAVEIGVGDRARFLGAKSFAELIEIYGDAAVLCVPTLSRESFGYAAAEAMAMGRAVVATPSGALPELLADGRGFISAAATPGALAAALQQALGDGDRRKRAERKARDFALNSLSVDTLGPQYEALYQAAAS